MNTDSYEQTLAAERFKKTLDAVPGKNVEAKAEILGVPTSTLYAYASGKKRLPLLLLQKVKELTDVNLNWLLCGKGEPFNENANSKQIKPDYFKSVQTLIENLVREKLLGIDYTRYEFNDLVVHAYNFLIDTVSFSEIAEEFCRITPFLDIALDKIKESHGTTDANLDSEVYRKYDEEKVERHTEEDQALDMAASIEELIDRKIEEFAKANQLAPPQKK